MCTKYTLKHYAECKKRVTKEPRLDDYIYMKRLEQENPQRQRVDERLLRAGGSGEIWSDCSRYGYLGEEAEIKMF